MKLAFETDLQFHQDTIKSITDLFKGFSKIFFVASSGNPIQVHGRRTRQHF